MYFLWKAFRSVDGTLSSPGTADFTSRSLLGIRRWGQGFYTVREGGDLESHRCRPHLVEVV